MTDRLLVGTRKGLVTVDRRSSGWEVRDLTLANVAVTELLDRGGDAPLVVAANHGHFGPKLYATTDGGETYEDLETPPHPALEPGEEPVIDLMRQEPLPQATQLIWALAATPDGALWAGTMPGGLFRSDDGGRSWAINRPLWDHPGRRNWFGGGNDWPVLHSIAADPNDAGRISIAVSTGGAWRTDDGGASWEPAGGMKALFMPDGRALDPTVQDVHHLVRCPSHPDVLWGQHHNGIYRSTDDGRTYAEIPEAGPSTFGFAVAVHPHDPDTAWFVPLKADEERIPVDARVVVTRTRDGGESFDVLDRGLPPVPAWDLVYRHALAVDETGDRLAFGSTTGNLWVSEDAGDSWAQVSAHLPPVNVVRFAAP